jgi:hypothetical protein
VADGNVYEPSANSVLVTWPNAGQLKTLSDVRTKLGLETSGRIGSIAWPL